MPLFDDTKVIVMLNDDETWTEVTGTHAYIIDPMFAQLVGSLQNNDISADEIALSPGVRALSIERLVRFYLAWENMHAHAYNVPDR